MEFQVGFLYEINKETSLISPSFKDFQLTRLEWIAFCVGMPAMTNLQKPRKYVEYRWITRPITVEPRLRTTSLRGPPQLEDQVFLVPWVVFHLDLASLRGPPRLEDHFARSLGWSF